MSTEKETSKNGKASPKSDGKQNSNSNVRKSHRIRVSGASGKHEDKELNELFKKFGDVSIEQHKYQDGVLVAAMDSVEIANKAVSELNGKEFQGQKLSLNNDSAKQRQPNPPRRSAPPMPMMMPMHDDYPVRILINSDHVGAIIGKGGETIKEITGKSRARIDVKREVVQRTTPSRKLINSQVVFISGAPEACTKACKEILSVCVADAKEKTREEIDLNLLAEDRFCGRIIGKDGKNLKIIREKTKTSIHLSNSPTVTTFDSDSTNFSMDRIVTVRGSLDGMCQAQAYLSEKLLQCHQMEMPQYQYPQMPTAPYGGGNVALGWPYVTFPALDPRRKFKNVGLRATS